MSDTAQIVLEINSLIGQMAGEVAHEHFEYKPKQWQIDELKRLIVKLEATDEQS